MTTLRDNKKIVLAQIAKEIENCKVCKRNKIGKAVPGEGNPNAQIFFVGEAPGREEAKTGRPFVGRSGKLLRSLIKGIDLKEEEVFITSPVKYLPKRGTPTKEDVEHGREHLLKQIEIINPKIIVTLGRVANFGILKEEIAVLSRHGEVIEKEGRKIFITIHPSAAIRFQKFKKVLIEDFKTLKKLIETSLGQ